MRNLVPLCLLSSITAPALIPALIPAASAQEQLWITQWGTSAVDILSAVAPDGAGGAVLTAFRLNRGQTQDFITLIRYDSEGNQLWIRHIGPSNRTDSSALISNGGGGVVLSGSTWGSMGGPSAGSSDAFLARFDCDGNQLWLTQFGGLDDDSGTALATEGTGEVMVASGTNGSLGGPNAGGWDVFLARYSIGSTCYPDCDQSTGVGILDLFDFLCFQDSFVSGEPYACDCDTSTGPLVCDLFDFLCFQDAFVAGCP